MVRTEKLTDTLIAQLPAQEKEYQVIDQKLYDFGVRVMPSGGKSFFIWQRHGGKLRRKSLGPVENMRCAEARRQASGLLFDEPQRDASQQQPDDIPCLRDFVRDVWIPHHNRHVKPSTARKRDCALKDVLPAFGDEKMDSISRADVIRWFDHISRDGLTKGNHCLDTLSSIYIFAESRDLVDFVPTRGVKKNKQTMRTRFLSHDEIDHLMTIMARDIEERHSPYKVQSRDIVTLLLLTGCRKGEIENLQWQEVNEDRLRLADSKTGARTVWLNEEARAIIARQPFGP